jgi:hypothetical protein
MAALWVLTLADGGDDFALFVAGPRGCGAHATLDTTNNKGKRAFMPWRACKSNA